MGSSAGHDSRYRALWQRMRRVVEAYSELGRNEEADYCVADFFLSFEDPDELERHVRAAEASARAHGVL